MHTHKLLFEALEKLFRGTPMIELEYWENMKNLITLLEDLKLGSHHGNELHRPPALVINLLGTIEGLLPNLHRW